MRMISRLLLIALLVPAFAVAQDTVDLQTSVRAALASDPRTNSMSAEQLDALAAELAAGAARQGMTAQDISWKPVPSEGAAAERAPECSVFPAYFCTISESFGFGEGDHTIPIWFAAIALMFLFIAGELRYHHRRARIAAQAAAPVATFSNPGSGI